MKERQRNTYRAGLWAEIIAALYLFFKGYRLLAWRYKSPVGEIDLIGLSKGVLVFVEVKQRATLDDGLLSITPHMKGRIGAAAKSWIARNPRFNGHPMRFDVIAITLPFSIRHMDNAWQGAP